MADNFIGLTNTGRVRDNNEDAFLAETLSNGWILACVIDGVGGYEGGEVAASIARQTILQRLQKSLAEPVQALKESLLLANENIYQEKLQNKGNDQMACVLTVALVDVKGNQFWYAHVGDTRLYLLRDQSLVKVTKDHSFVGFLEDSGRLSEKEAMTHPKRNEINKALGFDPQIDKQSDYIETGASPFLPGDTLLLCSDGLTDLVDNKSMAAILLSQKTMNEKAQDLIDAANIAGGKDNITVVIVSHSKKPAKAKATKPVKKNGSEEYIVETTPTQTVIESKPRQTRSKRSNVAVPVLALLCVLFAGVALYFWWQKNNSNKIEPPFVQHVLNEGEKKLSDSLGLANDSLNILEQAFGKSVVLSDTLFVRQDTLRINGNGIVLNADSTFNGPAIFATINNKALLLENIVFKNFSIAVVSGGKGVLLKNVQFQNCLVPVQRQIFLPTDSVLNGALKDTFITSRNSLPR